MSDIKSYLKTLIEAAFTSKKEYIAKLGKPKVSSTSTVTYEVALAGGEMNLTMSDDGWLSIYLYKGSLDVFASTAPATGWSTLDRMGAVIPVVKGQTLGISFGANMTRALVRLYRSNAAV